MKNFKTHLFTYNYGGAQYSLEIPAASADEAKERLTRIVYASYDGELVTKVPAFPASGMFVRLFTWVRNRL